MSDVRPPSGGKLWSSFTDDPIHGPLPVLLLMLTTMTGVIDAVSIIALGRVFVANMTGNVVFIGFGVARVPGFSLAASAAALGGFLAGAFVGGALVGRFAVHRGVLLRNACGVELVLVAVALVITVPADSTSELGVKVVVSALCAAAMGIQNTTARKLAVPDLTTTVLTMTLTGIAADARHSSLETSVRRGLAVVTMFAGAVVGALLVLHTAVWWALAFVDGILAAVVVLSAQASRRPASWQGQRS